MKILIAEDEPSTRQLLQFQLEQWGHTVISAGNGRQAWELLQTHDCQLVITDWDMPEITGIDLIRKIRQAERAGYLYVILLTSKSQRGDLVTGLTSGADDYLTKPFNKDELQARLQPSLRIIDLEYRLAERHRELAERNLELADRNQLLTDANRKMQRNLDSATKIQRAFLPSRVSDIAEVPFAWHFSPCDDLAGDMLHVLELDEEHVGVYVLDVSGHGVQAALLAVTACRFLSSQKDSSSVLWQRRDGSAEFQLASPAEAVRELNSRMSAQSRTEQFFTLTYGLLNRRSGEFRYVIAGHPAPLHVPAHGPTSYLPGDGLPIGIMETDYDEHSVRLAPDDRLFFYTDGVTETMNATSEQFGPARLQHAALTTSREPLATANAHIFAAVETFRGTAPIHDDVSLLMLQFAPLVSPPLRERRVRADSFAGASGLNQHATTNPLGW